MVQRGARRLTALPSVYRQQIVHMAAAIAKEANRGLNLIGKTVAISG